VPQDIYGELLTIHAFLRTFSELLPQLPSKSITLGELAFAFCSKDIENPLLLRLLDGLLSARRTCAEEEDFDEGKIESLFSA